MKIKTLLLLLTFAAPLLAQIDDDKSYQGFRVEKGAENVPADGELLTIAILPLGNGILYFRSGKDNTPLTGTYRFIIHNKRYVIGDIVKGLAHGNWEEYFYDGLYEKATYKHGRYEGKIYLYQGNPAADADHAEYTIKDGKTQHFIAYHKNGQIKRERQYNADGRVQGNVKTYDENGKVVEETNYVNGQIHGKRMRILHGGDIEQSNYVEGKQTGKYTRLYPNGKLKEKGTYDEEGKKTGAWTFGLENGDLKSEEEFLADRTHGMKRVYFSGNRLKSEEFYTNGKLNGKVAYYEEQPHTLANEGHFSDGRRHGVFKVYHNGILWKEAIYKEDREVGNKIYENGKLQIVKLLDETGSLTDVAKYDQAGKQVYKNQRYKKHRFFDIKEDPSGVIDIEF